MALRPLASLCLGLAALSAWGQNGAEAKVPETGSPSFCLFEVPADDGNRRRWVNLGIVQYVDAGNSEVKLVFGGGNLGSGHEVRIPMASRDEGLAFIARLRKAAGECRQGAAG